MQRQKSQNCRKPDERPSATSTSTVKAAVEQDGEDSCISAPNISSYDQSVVTRRGPSALMELIGLLHVDQPTPETPDEDLESNKKLQLYISFTDSRLNYYNMLCNTANSHDAKLIVSYFQSMYHPQCQHFSHALSKLPPQHCILAHQHCLTGFLSSAVCFCCFQAVSAASGRCSACSAWSSRRACSCSSWP